MHARTHGSAYSIISPARRAETTRNLLGVYNATEGRGMGQLDPISGSLQAAGSIVGAFGQMKAAKEDAKARKAEAKAAVAMQKRQLEADAITGRLESSQTERGKVLRYALFGLGGLALLTALGLFIASRKAKGKG